MKCSVNEFKKNNQPPSPPPPKNPTTNRSYIKLMGSCISGASIYCDNNKCFCIPCSKAQKLLNFTTEHMQKSTFTSAILTWMHFLSSVLKLHCSVYVCMHIVAALQYLRNKYREFCPKYVNAKAIEKLNLLFKALGSLTKQIFALAIFNNSYLTNYIRKENHLTLLLLSAFRHFRGWIS